MSEPIKVTFSVDETLAVMSELAKLPYMEVQSLITLLVQRITEAEEAADSDELRAKLMGER